MEISQSLAPALELEKRPNPGVAESIMLANPLCPNQIPRGHVTRASTPRAAPLFFKHPFTLSSGAGLVASKLDIY
jgi:hypothetical protein